MAASMTQAFPVSSAQRAVEINGQRTDIHCSLFSDYLYLIVTQYCKVGTLIEVKPETAISDMEGPTPMLSTKVLFGKDEPLTHVMARHIVNAVKSSKPVLLALSMNDTSRDTIFALLPVIQTCIMQASRLEAV